VADTARVLGRLYDGIEYRGFGQQVAETLAAHAGVPVYNGLTDQFHPTQILADLMTMQEHSAKPVREMTLAYLGDGGNNMANSLMVGSAKLGIDFRLAAPQACRPSEALVERARALAATSHGAITLTDDVGAAVAGADFLYTDVWVSMGDPESAWDQRIALLRPYQVNAAVLEATGNPRVGFLHCLPALHDRQTAKGEAVYQKHGLEGMEVTDEVFGSEHSLVFDQAENRLHTIKAVLVATLGG